MRGIVFDVGQVLEIAAVLTPARSGCVAISYLIQLVSAAAFRDPFVLRLVAVRGGIANAEDERLEAVDVAIYDVLSIESLDWSSVGVDHGVALSILEA